MESGDQGRLLPVIAAGVALLAAIGLGAFVVSGAQVDQSTDDGIVAEAQGYTLDVTYQSATVYAGSTDYYFENAGGEIVEFRVSNLPQDQTIQLPDGLLESGELDGPPGANPDLVGKNFVLLYDAQDELVGVEPAR